MTKERLYLFDTTLRDGAQTNGVDFTLHDKLAIMAMLDDIGIDYVEGGYPGANPIDTELFSQSRPRHLARAARRQPAYAGARVPRARPLARELAQSRGGSSARGR